ncbi:hypothetical protein O0911_06205 [Clostridioides difficile]|nr:hypothetical protein [Clostridioides difficile]MCZ1114098.1 hypothetical protein [Clostridioides difficile]MDI6393627.1 hypothetical protein [Clostridioides difficile]
MAKRIGKEAWKEYIVNDLPKNALGKALDYTRKVLLGMKTFYLMDN